MQTFHEFSSLWSSLFTHRNDFSELPIPAHLWPESDPALSFVEQWFALFHTQSIGPRLFVDAILESHQDVPSFRDGLQVQKVIEAAIRSHQTGCWVAVD
jgi:predicted dehydrogenase